LPFVLQTDRGLVDTHYGGGAMTIQPVSSIGSSTNVSTAGISQMQSQIASLQRQITSGNNRAATMLKTKAKKIQVLELQMQQLQNQLLQLQAKAQEQAAKKSPHGIVDQAA